MNTIEIPERGLVATLPSCEEELTNEQFASVLKNWLILLDGKINYYEFRLILLYDFLGIKRGPFQDMRDKRLSKEQLEDKFANVWQLTELLDWLIRVDDSDQGNVSLLNLYGIENRLPVIENSFGSSLIAFDDGMLNITFGEYRAAYGYFEAYTRDKKYKDLDRLMAVLYLPERHDYNEIRLRPEFDGRRREYYNAYLTEHYAELMKSIPFWQKYAAYLWFGNCDRWLKEGELDMNGKPLSFAPLFSKSNASTDDLETLDENDLGMTELLYSVAESNLFGGPESVDRTLYIDVLSALLHWKKQNDKMKAKP